MKFTIPLLASLLLGGAVLRSGICADELKLKDGTTIVGTIVGFEDNSFKVRTSYGFAMVQKDQLVSVKIEESSSPSETAPGGASEKSPAKAADTGSDSSKPKASTETPAQVTANKSDKSPAPDTRARAPIMGKDSRRPTSSGNSQAPTKESSPGSQTAAATPVPASSPATTAAASAPPLQRPLEAGISASQPQAAKPAPPPPQPPQPMPIREEVTGNTYTNDTYAFRMYKPPDWDMIASAQKILPGSIAAMGTADQTTYLIIGVEPAGKSPALSIEATERRLSTIFENYSDTGEQQIAVSGLTAIEKHFHGDAEDRDWSGIVVFLPRAGSLYTIFGMTSAESDLVQIQENVIARTISSLRFLP